MYDVLLAHLTDLDTDAQATLVHATCRSTPLHVHPGRQAGKVVDGKQTVLYTMGTKSSISRYWNNRYRLWHRTCSAKVKQTSSGGNVIESILHLTQRDMSFKRDREHLALRNVLSVAFLIALAT